MNRGHMFITLKEGGTYFRIGKEGWGANPAKDLEEHLKNISYFVNTFKPESIEFRIDIEQKDVSLEEKLNLSRRE